MSFRTMKCQYYCTSEGPLTNLHCFHCHTRYCGACLHGEAGKMESLIKCAGCGKKPRIKPNAQRRGWGHEVDSPIGTSKTVLTPPVRGKTSQAYWAYKNAALMQHANDAHGGFTWDATPQKRSIFDKLTDPSLYTGSHKHRFDAQGRGRGLEGRDSVAKGIGTGAVIQYYGDGPVTSIAQLVRNDKLDPQHMNQIKRFPDGTSVLSPRNRSWRGDDSKWRPEVPRGVYPQNNPTYQRTPLSSPRPSTAMSGHRSVGGSPMPPAHYQQHHPHYNNGSMSARSSRDYHDNDGMSYSASVGALGSPHEITRLRESDPHAAQAQQQHEQFRRMQEEYMRQQQQYQSPQQQHQQQQHHTPQQHPHPSDYYSQSQQQQSYHSPPPADAHSTSMHTPRGASTERAPITSDYVSSPIFDKLTDPSQYTGAHRARFDAQGHGLGLAGRTDVPLERFQGDAYANADVRDLAHITRPQYNAGSRYAL